VNSAANDPESSLARSLAPTTNRINHPPPIFSCAKPTWATQQQQNMLRFVTRVVLPLLCLAIRTGAFTLDPHTGKGRLCRFIDTALAETPQRAYCVCLHYNMLNGLEMRQENARASSPIVRPPPPSQLNAKWTNGYSAFLHSSTRRSFLRAPMMTKPTIPKNTHCVSREPQKN
jgi:hypothetical protein